MNKLTGNEIRSMWLKFFSEKGHSIEKSASLVPLNDPTLLWINAGVAPLKKYFDGSEKPNNPKMTNAQKCIRTNDIDNVGKTARHHTFFEMLGNFSIGDYFREDAIKWWFELLTSDKYFGFDLEKLYFTVYPTDKDSFNTWKNLGVDESHIIKTEYNFWEIGEGPCGPCTEVFFDRGEKYGDLSTDAIRDDIENDRYIEIGNIVLSQFNSKAGLDRSEYPELPNKNIDTGMGLERMACVLQEVETNYETDIFMSYINEVEELSGIKYEGQMAFKVISDHIRTLTMAISDGAILSNEGRGYVLRRILRRAVRYGRTLNIHKPFLYTIVPIVIEKMGEYYTNLKDNKDLVMKIIKNEEEKFLSTLADGEKKLHDIIEILDGNTISGKDAFTLYDTYGFPIELTVEYAEEAGVGVDLDGFYEEMETQKANSRNARSESESMSVQNEEMINYTEESEFTGYNNLKQDSNVIAIFDNGIGVTSNQSDTVEVVLDKTTLYAESGGQLSDKGRIVNDNLVAQVIDVQKMPNGQHLHKIQIEEGNINVGDKVISEVCPKTRRLTAYNHSATHLLHKALKDVLGSHVKQQGSQVSRHALRFDFNNYNNLTDDEILKIENIVNNHINEAHDVVTKEMTIDEAKKLGAEALFGEKYGDVVRVVNMDYSVELCGGTHVKNTGEIERFAIKSIESKGSGIFRVEGLTNENIIKGLSEITDKFDNEINNIISKGNSIVSKAKEEDINITFDFDINTNIIPSYEAIILKRKELAEIKGIVKDLEKEYRKLVEAKTLNDLSDFDTVEEINSINTIITKVNDYDGKALKQVADRLVEKHNDALIFIANVANNKIVFVAKASNEIVKKGINCGNLVREAAQICGGNGGGRPDFAQAGAKNVDKIDEAIDAVKKVLISL